MDQDSCHPHINTQVLPVDVNKAGRFVFNSPGESILGNWDIQLFRETGDAANLLQAVEQLQTSSMPVAFPTETVYGLGADATRNDAVDGIYKAKQRPADNPLIVHVSSLAQLRQLLTTSSATQIPPSTDKEEDVIPAIYKPLIARFWPGPLTIILPLPEPSPLARSVTGNLSTFGVRMPSSRLALALIHLAGVPVAAPSANTSTRPSPTTAAHVLHDLQGRIELIIDGGPCLVGVESTVVDGLVRPPLILRPGGVSIEMLRLCPGWENVELGYRDGTEISVPRAPGMKYKHYSPSARVILVNGQLSIDLIRKYIREGNKIGLARTKTWTHEHLTRSGVSISSSTRIAQDGLSEFKISNGIFISSSAKSNVKGQGLGIRSSISAKTSCHMGSIQVVCTDLGTEATTIAQNLFSALRDLDLQGVDVIFVEGIEVSDGQAAAAILNRLRKAAELEIQS
ncbi:MAG: hypothetical protein Q9219_007667 [cf. Caloplaca sp. 3 TL-2023]